MKRLLGAALLAALLISGIAFATSHGASAAPDSMSDGEIRRVDKDAKKITIRHGPLENLEMPAMTMVFQVSDPAMIELVKPGDKVRFRAEKIGAAFTVTKIQLAR